MKDLMVRIVYSKYFFILMVILLGVVSSYVFGDDNRIEEITEEIIKAKTEINIDLTPNSKENNL
jgi:hypothetical protein